MADAISLDMTVFWTPTVRSYLGRVSKARIVEAVREGASDEAAKQIDGMKKQAMAETAEQLLAGKGWLPALLRTHALSQPAEQSESVDPYTVAAK
jgi:ParB family chromosome partitioning protein